MREIVLQFTVKWHGITLRRALAKRRAKRGNRSWSAGAAARRGGAARTDDTLLRVQEEAEFDPSQCF